jgi:quinol monooxygenase YgiN
MIIVIGHVIATPAHREQVLALAVEHSVRSRSEPGCLAHNCHVDIEDPARITFTEHWADQASLQSHFLRPESAAFVRAMRDMSPTAPVMHLYQASELAFPGVR